ncbi:hypothetical protein CKO21_15540 [Rhodovibrio salinarum]|uniref:Uncharacterized protein n=1 Tax=Rhodovibrio salinarum TaxID=1087 RepID=A0A934QL91_9PROT|nr:hypothetical protein [Rhodovibrio salinarum]
MLEYIRHFVGQLQAQYFGCQTTISRSLPFQEVAMVELNASTIADLSRAASPRASATTAAVLRGEGGLVESMG